MHSDMVVQVDCAAQHERVVLMGTNGQTPTEVQSPRWVDGASDRPIGQIVATACRLAEGAQ